MRGIGRQARQCQVVEPALVPLFEDGVSESPWAGSANGDLQ